MIQPKQTCRLESVIDRNTKKSLMLPSLPNARIHTLSLLHSPQSKYILLQKTKLNI